MNLGRTSWCLEPVVEKLLLKLMGVRKQRKCREDWSPCITLKDMAAINFS
jgi:hypothetical protein